MPQTESTVLDFTALLLDTLGYTNDEFVSLGYEDTTGVFHTAVMSPTDGCAAKLPSTANAYYGVNPVRGPARKNFGRGREADITRLAALPVDLDIKPGGCPSRDVAHDIVATLSGILGTRPSATVDSGHGVHAYWPISDGQIVDGDIGRARALLKRWGRLVTHVAATHNAQVDNIYDLPRMMRRPGSHNNKNLNGQGAPLVTAHTDTGGPLTIDEIDERLTELGIDESDEDRAATRDTISPPTDWRWADTTCPYVARMIAAWATDRPKTGKGRHQWLLYKAVKLESAHRLGCLTEADHHQAQQTLARQFTEILRTTEPRREPRKYEIDPEAWDYGITRTSEKTDEQATAELGNHKHWAVALDDAHIGPYIAEHYLAGEYLYSGAFGWMHYDERRWEHVEEAVVAEVIRRGVIDLHFTEAQAGADADRLKAISHLFSAARMRSILWIARNYLCRTGAEFDAHPDLLNVRNGVVDLRDGTLHPHDPELLLTKVTMVDYIAGATHPDWAKALTAVTADEADWLQVRFGQGLTGYPPSDDILVVLKGSGENGKSTIIDGVRGATGAEYAIPLPDRVLLARPGDHPTEMMTLRDARLAFMEEFPELGHLNVKRLKDLTGTEWMTARLCGKDSVRWRATHSVFVTTNYLPRVDESDHGTWRRLAMVAFPHRYRKPHEPIETELDIRGDPGLRERMRRGGDGRHEAVLAWLIVGAAHWYADGQTMPEPPVSIVEATAAWRRSSDMLLRYLEEQLVFDPGAHVMSKELYEDFAEWLKERGHVVWTDQNFSARLGQHPEATAKGVTKKTDVRQSRPGLSRRASWGTPQRTPKQYAAWLGVRFRDPDEEPKKRG